MGAVGWIAIGVVVLLLIFVIVAYNRLVALRNRIEAAWSQIDVQLKRRYDLIPNLIETVKGYAAHERETLEAVIAALWREQERPRRDTGWTPPIFPVGSNSPESVAILVYFLLAIAVLAAQLRLFGLG